MMMKIIVELDMKFESSEWVIIMYSNVDKYIELRYIEVCVIMNMRF